MRGVTGLLVVVLTSLVGRSSGIKPNGGYCIGTQCFTVFQDPSDFPTAQGLCEDNGGHLMTVRSTVPHEILPMLLGNFTGRFWIGLHRVSVCPDAAGPLNGFQWVTRDSQSDFSDWAPGFDGSCSSHRCVSVSTDNKFQWIQEPCGERAAGFLCEYTLNDPCRSLAVAEGESVTYRTPMGFEAEGVLSLPGGSVAVRMPAGTKYLCVSEKWQQAPWSCGMLEGGCEYKCAVDLKQESYCSCPPGHSVNPANKVTCQAATEDPCADERRCPRENSLCVPTVGGFQCVCMDGYKLTGGRCVDVDECVSAPCEHMCTNTPGSYRCSCYDGYKADTHSPNKCELHCGKEECAAECDPNDKFMCYCPEGYVSEELDSGIVCIDLDECISEYCEQGCKNLFGSYKCSCFPGYTLVGQFKCIKNADGRTQAEGSTSAATPDVSTTPVPRPDPTRQPSAVTVGGMVGIIVCTVVFMVLLVCLAHHILNRGEMESAGALKAPEDEEHGLQQVTSDTDTIRSSEKHIKHGPGPGNRATETVQDRV